MNILWDILLFALVGFCAQLIDGALGMAYGVSSTTFLLSLGVPPAIASASVHTAEVFTTAVSGLSHWKAGNVDKQLVLKLLLPGVIGAVTGAYLLVSFSGDILKPYIAAYLLVMGVVIIVKAIRKIDRREDHPEWLIPLGLVGGFFDAIGGGGWGPIVTTTLVARGNDPRFTIGSVNTAEFFVTLSQTIVFLSALGLKQNWPVIAGLMLGGVLAAPLAAVLARKLPARVLMLIVGILIILLSLRTIILM